MILLDTSVLVDADLSSLDPAESYAASILSRAELEFGVAVAPEDARFGRRARLEFLDAAIDWLPFDEESSRSYGTLARAMHAGAPAQARRTDTFIAAQAHRHGVPLMTRNARDFQRVASLVAILTWPPPDADPE
ncbi:MAG: PIN domain-containing protein [Bifidobacteriaceae bacterium]|jgi:predicted nucleic acid-binding protein|nr:PIN domain-containing protein [Bifidobacteriaceae bacterium]